MSALFLILKAEDLLVDGGMVVTDKRNGKGEVVSAVKAAQASPPSISSSKKSVQSVVPGSTIEAHVDHFSAGVAKNGMNADVTEVSLMRTQTLYWQHILYYIMHISDTFSPIVSKTSVMIGAVDNVGGLGDSKLLIKEEVSHAASVVGMNVVSPHQVTSYINEFSLIYLSILII